MRIRWLTRVVGEREKKGPRAAKMAQEMMVWKMRSRYFRILFSFLSDFIQGHSVYRHVCWMHRWFSSSVFHWPSSTPKTYQKRSGTRSSSSGCTLMYAFAHIHTKDLEDHPAVFISYDCCCWRNPLAILVIINYSKWINLTRHRTTEVIFEFVAEIYLPIKLSLESNRWWWMHWNYTLWAFEKMLFFSAAVSDSDDDDDDNDVEKWSLCVRVCQHWIN